MEKPFDRLTLVATALTQRRGPRVLFDQLSLSVASGETVLLLGANGSGKTTLLRTIAGFLPPEHGTIVVETAHGPQPVADACHVVGHLNAIKPQFTVRENARFWASYLGGDPSTVDTALACLNLEELEDIPAGYLSAGQKRRLGLTRLLLAPRPIWLLDEPTAALDTASAAAVEHMIARHNDLGGIALVATHLPLALPRTRHLRLGLEQVAA